MGTLACLLKEMGHRVSGSDQNVYPPMSDLLRENGIELFSGYDPKNLDHNPDLVIIGDPHDRVHARDMEAARAASGALAERVHVLGEVPWEDVRRWYTHAAAFAFPSYLETFGHPLLEAMASGLPVLAADTPVFREIGGEAVRYADPHDTAALAEGLSALLADPQAAAALGAAARERAAAFSWERCAERTLALFDAV